MPDIYICLHCGDEIHHEAKLCNNCSTAEKRKAMDEANRKNFEENNLPPYICKYCDK